MLKRMISMVVAIMLLTSISIGALAHPGRTDANGGHNNRKTGEYHYHNSGKSSSSSSSETAEQSESSVRLSPELMLVKIGHSAKLSAVMSPEGALETALVWESSDKGLASVDDSGTVTAHAVGTCTVSATAGSGGRSSSAQVLIIKDIDQAHFPIGKHSDREDIITVQSMLIMLGELTGKADGQYGTLTEDAIDSLAKRAGAQADGATYALYTQMLTDLELLIAP